MNMQTKDEPLPRRCASCGLISCGHINNDPRVGAGETAEETPPESR